MLTVAAASTNVAANPSRQSTDAAPVDEADVADLGLPLWLACFSAVVAC
jgi:hypothetical protein